MMCRASSRLALVCLATFLLGDPSRQVTAQQPPSIPALEYEAGALMVRVSDPDTAAKLAQLLSALGGTGAERFTSVDGLYRIRLPDSLSVTSAADLARQLEGVVYAEPNFIVRTQTVPNDPSFGDLWALHNTGQAGGASDADIDAPEAWDITTGDPSVVVGVIDTGIDYVHPDLASNMFQNQPECTGTPGVDDDGNGFADDCHGIDTFNNDSDPLDDQNHGTHVAGTIGAAGNNGVGVTGVNWRVQLMPCKFLNGSGSGSTAGAVRCLDYIAAMKDRGVNIVATNNSWGGGGFSQALFDAIEAQRQRGILFITAAGNSGTNNDVAPGYPAAYDAPNVIAVAATARTDTLSSFSNVGRRSVHLGAPGSAILSTTRDGTYSTLSGTSMATPHVAGVAALLEAADPGRDWRAIRNLLLSAGDDVTALQSATVAGKRLNAARSLACSDSTLFSRLQPRLDEVSGNVGAPIVLSAIHIDCALPVGNTVTVLVSNGSVVTLRDDGVSPDRAPSDGIFTGVFVPLSVPPSGEHVLTFQDGDSVRVIMQSATPYTFSGVSSAYRNLSGTSLALSDDSSQSIAPPFPILFAGHPYATVFVSNNGNLNFSQSFNAFSNVPLPTSSMGGPLIAPFWDDLVSTPADPGRNVVWAVLGSPPNRELVIEWRNVSAFFCDAVAEIVTFQVVFFEQRSDILFNYPDTTFGGSCAAHDRGGSATVGVQVSPALATLFGFNASNLSNGLSLLWTHGSRAPTTFTDEPLTAGTSVKAVHINELRARINALRARFELGPRAWTDPVIVPGVTIVKAQHLAEMRSAVIEAYEVAEVTPPTFTDVIRPGVLVIRGQHIVQLRNAVLGLERVQGGGNTP
jgi:subtilisin family serine protease